MEKIIIGSDHGGFAYKDLVKTYLSDKGYEVIDMGTHSLDSCDYPDIAKDVSLKVLEENTKGILICGTGLGISIAANKINGIRAALCHDHFSAKMSRRHNDANIIAFGERVIGQGLMIDILNTWLSESFEGDRHANRVAKICALEGK